jgi:hypothetical protein
MPADPIPNLVDFSSEKLWSFFCHLDFSRFQSFSNHSFFSLKKIKKKIQRDEKYTKVISLRALVCFFLKDFLCTKYKRIFILRKKRKKRDRKKKEKKVESRITW